MPKVVACIIARTVSKRLPLKVLRDFYPNVGMLDFLIQRVKTQKKIDEIYLCTSTESVDDILEDVALRNNIKIYRGSSDAVIERMLAVGAKENADVLIRITGDNPFTAVELINNQVDFLVEEKLDYVRVMDLPVGATAEVFTHEALVKCNELMDPSVSEYLMLYLFEPNNFKCGVIKAFENDFSAYSLTVDNPDDLVRTKKIVEILQFDGDYSKISLSKILMIIKDDTILLPAKIISPAGEVKLPFDKVISFQEFKLDMERRIQNSKYLKLYE
jgi:spore coat polysaccharide biosynthesis protein SpsF